jgi:hypothetical protein
MEWRICLGGDEWLYWVRPGVSWACAKHHATTFATQAEAERVLSYIDSYGRSRKEDSWTWAD